MNSNRRMGIMNRRGAMAWRGASVPARGRSSLAGFSLLELLFVIAIIGMLAALVLPRLFGAGESAKVKTTASQMRLLEGALEEFRTVASRYPTEEEGLQALVTLPVTMSEDNWKGPYLQRETLPRDGWDRAFIYRIDPSFGFRLISLGADGQEGGEGFDADIDNRK